eukprot:21084-Heterococcus_DN1.PRE.6
MQATTNMHVIASVVHAQDVFMRKCIIGAQGHTLRTRSAFRCDLEFGAGTQRSISSVVFAGRLTSELPAA